MLYLGETSVYYKGITALPDHANPLQWYFMPVYPQVARDPGTGKPMLTLYKFRGGASDGGLLNVDVDLSIDPTLLDELGRRIRSELNLSGGVQLSPLPVVDGWAR